MDPGTFLQFAATGTYTDGSTQNLTSTATWSTGDATIVSVVTTGPTIGLGAALANPPSGVGAATIITAAVGTVSGNTGVSVAAPTLNSITITDGNVTIAQGTTHQYTAMGIYSDGGERDVSDQVTWGSSATNIATIGTLGKATAVSAGTSTISAAMGSVNAPTVSLNVTTATVSSIVVAPVLHTIAPRTLLAFTAVATFSDASVQDVTQIATWASSAPGIATVDNTVHIGFVTGVSAGPVTISAALGGQMGSAPLTVSNATLSSIALRPTSANIAAGSNIELVATGTFSDSSQQIISLVATWGSSDGTVAVVNSFGEVTGLATGTSTITASLAGVQNTADITVENIAGLAITAPSTSIPAGAIAHLTATATLTDSSTQNVTGAVTWTSSTPAVALAGDVSNTRGEVFGIAQGTSLIGALFSTLPGTVAPQIASTQVTVTPATLVSIAITPANPTIAEIKTQEFTLTGTYSDNTTQVLTSQAQWSSSTLTTAIISKTGVATPTGTGTSTITATFGNLNTTTLLTVN
jgi:hypothetical protein